MYAATSDGCMGRPRLRTETIEALQEIKDERGYSTYDEAVTYLLREEGYHV